MLGTPILASMVRTLIVKKEDRNIKNRADLYKQFFDYIFMEYQHGNSKLSRQLRGEVRIVLQKISYDAIDRKMEAQKIPVDFCRQCIGDPDLKLKAITIDVIKKAIKADIGSI